VYKERYRSSLTVAATCLAGALAISGCSGETPNKTELHEPPSNPTTEFRQSPNSRPPGPNRYCYGIISGVTYDLESTDPDHPTYIATDIAGDNCAPMWPDYDNTMRVGNIFVGDKIKPVCESNPQALATAIEVQKINGDRPIGYTQSSEKVIGIFKNNGVFPLCPDPSILA